MPIYEYRCDACGFELEALQKISDPALEVCTRCQAPKLKKKVSAPAFRLKGAGWYETDFKSGNKKNLAGDKPPSTEGDKAKPASGGESKPASNTESKTAGSAGKAANSSSKVD
ncbi:MAG: zinc ribbon domain-containing protein [Cellvibrionaceae bacterium]|nr:zinc ribbon domain-containing protein [Cellvibrionaceae bacterium]